MPEDRVDLEDLLLQLGNVLDKAEAINRPARATAERTRDARG
jgi:hypothetical protein